MTFKQTHSYQKFFISIATFAAIIMVALCKIQIAYVYLKAKVKKVVFTYHYFHMSICEIY